ncbi:bifunctional 4-hydroxy-2-oxoglutarate aldolase/2-dehydro-3-deoxy-phosphogluconate aldolase [Acidocella sp. KAb 2-4]|uniref:bifunctional 4-hydroxy-2-oxoglutarate aldolase/2-dehydro-3-deoxy-phosphogluconate aldolase n=1 Tax=Acidocella sp. KAb 2-4 TaxID=2885158 RepID=UPI001D0629F3|nr:bifunctional 4-hydroxy-2-oxoglutarate aldolase/2-dehydro-3-deoxy-phosphogluconate aldolase [Acidocella sp. KAb 2-4]MCB5945035.1 bifunctional 4-hydroxy-2-oxoglutarate aldolase/2-dehydro-3-deoxy-phosphogluconate aldolase [Acidocella sp. KAb 2-4]
MLQDGLENILRAAPVVPVVIIDDAADAVKLARALVAGGLPAIEVTLRTAAGIEAIRAIAQEVEGAIPGVGTVLEPAHYHAAAKAGACFAVSPGATPRLLDAAAECGIPPLPGIATVSEAMALIERGYRFAKFFPAEASGGAAFLSAIASPVPQLQFCPTGGITPENAPRYLKLPNVICVGGSWMVSRAAIKAGDWAGITEAARAATRLAA